jgi:membrane fusion protein, copper/silver efflux system
MTQKKNLLIAALVFLLLAAGIVLYLNTDRADKISPPAQKYGQGHEQHGIVQQPSDGETKDDDWGDDDEVPTVHIPQDMQRFIGVKTTTAEVRPVRRTIRAVGRIEYDERRLATVNTKIEGWIEKLHVNYTGQFVKRGQPLAEVYSPELIASQQEYLNILRWAKQDEKLKNENIGRMLSGDSAAMLEAARQRLRFWDITDSQIRRIEESGSPIRTLAVYSPVSGYVVERMALQGMRVMPGEKLFDIADLSTVWVVADIFEFDLPWIKLGQTAVISLNNMPGREYTSKIDYVYPTLSAETRTAKIRFSIPNPGGQLKPQMFTNVEVKVDLGNKLSVPNEAVIDTGMRQIVYLDKGEGYFEPREVVTGLASDEMIEIIKGLDPGDKVASSANFLIDSEARLKGIVK